MEKEEKLDNNNNTVVFLHLNFIRFSGQILCINFPFEFFIKKPQKYETFYRYLAKPVLRYFSMLTHFHQAESLNVIFNYKIRSNAPVYCIFSIIWKSIVFNTIIARFHLRDMTMILDRSVTK